MEALTAEMQASIRKRSSERLRVYLIKAGRDEDEVMTWDRNTLMEEWALELGKEEEEFKASPASPVETDYELQRRRLEFEIRKYEEQKEKEEREERRREEKEEREERRREEEKKEQKKQEKEEWLSCEDVANAADIYVASHDGGSDLVHRGHPIPRYNNWTRSQPQVQVNNQTAQPKTFKPEVRGEGKIGARMSQEEAKVKGLCFLCHQKGHRAKECQTNRSYKKVGTCMVGNPTEEVIDTYVEKVNVSH